MFSFVNKNVGKNIRRYKKWSAKKFVSGKKKFVSFCRLVSSYKVSIFVWCLVQYVTSNFLFFEPELSQELLGYHEKEKRGDFEECFSVIFEDIALRKNCPCSELFWSVFSHIRTKYREIRSISPYSVQMRENADQNNSKYRQLSRSVAFKIWETI